MVTWSSSGSHGRRWSKALLIYEWKESVRRYAFEMMMFLPDPSSALDTCILGIRRWHLDHDSRATRRVRCWRQLQDDDHTGQPGAVSPGLERHWYELYSFCTGSMHGSGPGRVWRSRGIHVVAERRVPLRRRNRFAETAFVAWILMGRQGCSWHCWRHGRHSIVSMSVLPAVS